MTRVLVAYAKGHADIKPVVDKVLKDLGIPATALFSTLGRTAARGIETIAIGDAMQGWVMELVENVKNGDTQTYQAWTMPDKGMGYGLNDVPRDLWAIGWRSRAERLKIISMWFPRLGIWAPEMPKANWAR